MIKHSRIYLASQSPRRRELLKQIGVNFEMLLLRSDARRGVDVDESPVLPETPAQYVQRVCRTKAQMACNALAWRKLPPLLVLAADTTVTLDGKIFGKPSDANESADMLRALSGRTHQVLTAVAVAFGERVEMRLSSTEVSFVELSDERIRRYVSSNEAHDKAGGYAIQGMAGAFVERIEGSYSGVMGLPLFETTELLKMFGHPTP